MLLEWVPYVHNSAYSFMAILLTFYRCFYHGLKMCIWFEYYPWISFCHFFRILNLVIFEARILSKCMYIGYLVCVTLTAVLCGCFWNFTGVFVMVWRCACDLDIIIRLIFATFFHILNLVIFQSWILLKCIDSGYLVCTTPPAVLCQSFSNFKGVFVVWRLA